MLSEIISFHDGKVVKDDFIDINKSLESQADNLYEDMFQVVFENGDNYAIDVGWYGEEVGSGSFKCYLVKNHDWDNPIKVEETRNPKEVVKIIESLNELRLEISR